MEMTPQRWANTCAYLQEVFGREDEQLRTLMARAVAAGIPDIAVSAEVGRLLKLLASMCGEGRGAMTIVEVGTLAGYSGIWLARGLRSGGKLFTIEINPDHARFAGGEFKRAGVADRVEQKLGAALDILPQLAGDLGPASIDLAFVDGVKSEYAAYFRHLRPLIKPGGLFLADNIVGSSWWIDEPPGTNPDRDAVDRFNRLVASDADFEAAGVPVRQGVMVARRLR
jgi:predicted O-methyltransferase YrrM